MYKTPFLSLSVSCLTTFIFLMSNNSQAQNTIQWIDIVLPPIHHIKQGIGKDQGVTDGITQLIQENLSQYHQSRKIVSPNRLFKIMKETNNSCNPSMKRNAAREEFMYFSLPSVFTPANGITIMQQDRALFEGLSLTQLLKNKKLKLGYTQSRSFGKAIDEVLKQTEGDSNIYPLGGSDSYSRLLSMLVKGRINYVLGFPFEFGYVQAKMGLKNNSQNDMIFLPIKEAGDYSVSHVACSKTEQGKKIIAAIDKLLLDQRQSTQYRNIFEKWLDKKFIQQYRHAYNQQFAISKVQAVNQ